MSRSRSCRFRLRIYRKRWQIYGYKIAIKHEVAYGLLISIFRFDLGLCYRSTEGTMCILTFLLYHSNIAERYIILYVWPRWMLYINVSHLFVSFVVVLVFSVGYVYHVGTPLVNFVSSKTLEKVYKQNLVRRLTRWVDKYFGPIVEYKIEDERETLIKQRSATVNELTNILALL